ncbi:MAG: hypothetical protein JW889_16470 [Verrucomicrobia bacterium]|nr:hypothetical protein [Verrucomicrobiota bacterium]
MSHCVNDRKAAAFSCAGCAKKFCTDCAVHGGSEHASVLICPECGGRLDPLEVRETVGPAHTFSHYLVAAPVWPLWGRGALVLFLSALFVLALVLAAPVAYGFAATAHAVVGIIAAAFFWFIAGGYLVMLLFGTIRTTALREEGPPAAPSEAPPLYMIGTALRLAAVLILWTLPAVAAARLADGTPATWEQFGRMMSANVGTLILFVIRPGFSLVVRVLAVLGLAMLPMSLLAVARLDSLRGLNPFMFVPRLVRVAGHYALTCIAFYAVPLVVALLAIHVFGSTIKAYWSLESFSDLAQLAPHTYVLLFAASVILVYATFLAARVLGSLAAANADRLEWD